MTPIESFISRWAQSGAAERANYQMFLSELCDLLGAAAPSALAPPALFLQSPRTLTQPVTPLK